MSPAGPRLGVLIAGPDVDAVLPLLEAAQRAGFDAAQLWLSRTDDHAEWRRSLDALASRIALVHAKDVRAPGPDEPQAAAGEVLLPAAGAGIMDYARFAELVRSRCPGIDVVVEHVTPETVTQARARAPAPCVVSVDREQSLDRIMTARLLEPPPFRVYQRHGFRFAQAHANTATPDAMGTARVGIAAGPTRRPDTVRVAVTGLGAARDFALTKENAPFDVVGDAVRCSVELPAGGWYGLSVELGSSDGVEVLHGGPIGIGEVYLVAGQSYAANANDSLFTIDDPEGRVVALDPIGGTWRVAHDPQPTARVPAEHWGARAVQKLVPSKRIFGGGSIWPAAMSLLRPVLRVPVGMANVAVGATSIERWLPGTTLHGNLLTVADSLQDFRAVLWQQGESDVIAETPIHVYRERFLRLRQSLEEHLGRSVDWLVAKSTYHPTVYSKPNQEMALRAEFDAMCQEQNGVYPGPDTDQLGGSARSTKGFSQHFSREGQELAGALWFSALLRHLEATTRT